MNHSTEPLSDEVLADHFRQHAPAIVKSLQEAGQRFLGDKAPSIEYLETDPVIRIDGSLVDISPDDQEQKSIGRTLHVPAFAVVTYKHYAATREEPEDWDEVHLETVRGVHNVAHAALSHWFRLTTESYFDAEGEAAAYAEMETD